MTKKKTQDATALPPLKSEHLTGTKTEKPNANGRRARARAGKKSDPSPGNGEMFDKDDIAKLRRETPRLSVPHDNQLTVLALGAHARTLTGLAEKNRTNGYRLAAATQTGDARAIVERIVPLFAEQAEIPLATEAESRAAIANMLRPVVRRAMSEKYEEAGFVARLTYHVEKLAQAVYDRAFNDGLAAREMDPIVAVVRAAVAHDSSLDEQIAEVGK